MEITEEGFWTVSDLHLGHRLVSELWGFVSIEQHDEMVLSNLREIPDGATTGVFGGYFRMALWRLGELKRGKSFTMILVQGSHDRMHPMCGLIGGLCC